MPINNDLLILQFWYATPEERKVLLTNQPPNLVMWFDAEKNSRHAPPTVIKWYYISKDNDSSHRPIIVGEKHEISLLGFINLGINEQEACDFPQDFLRDWVIHASPANTGGHVDTSPPLSATPLTHHAIITESTTR